MASRPSNFDAEIKKGMQPKGAKTSTNAAPTDKAPKASGSFNAKPKPSTPQPQDTSASTTPMSPTHQAMIDAGNAHMAAIHAHINSMAGEG